MSFQAYLDAVKAKTGKSPAEFAKLAAQKDLTRHGEIVGWLKADYELGHGHATAIAGVILKSGSPPRSDAKKMDDLFSGTKASWRKPCNAIPTNGAADYPIRGSTPTLKYWVGVVPRVFLNMEMKALGVL
jgi:hypothetical protein